MFLYSTSKAKFYHDLVSQIAIAIQRGNALAYGGCLFSYRLINKMGYDEADPNGSDLTITIVRK